MELKIGKMTRKELAEWFNVKPNTYDHTKKQKLEELKMFAEFEEVYGGVNIIEIKIPEYAKKGSRAYNIIRIEFFNAWHKSGYDTAARVGAQIWRNNKELQELISENTAKSYSARIRKEYYGKVYADEGGSKGTCKYAYVKSNNWDEAVLLTDEQNMKVNSLRRVIYTNEQEPLLYDAYIHGEINKEEYEEGIASWYEKEKSEQRYSDFINGISEILGFTPAKVTMIQDYEESIF